MSTIKILDFDPDGLSLFCQHLEFLAKAQGWALSFESHPRFQMDLLQDATMARVNVALSASVLSQVHVQPTLVRVVQCVDSFAKDSDKWLPRLMSYEALRRVLIDSAADLDIRLPAYVVGHDELARISSSVLSQVGFSEIYVVGKDALQLTHQVAQLRRNHLGIKFIPLMADQLTIQSTSAAIIVNTVNLVNDPELLSDLSYFNFMKRGGYALDLNLLPFVNPLLEEAEKAELRVLSPISVAAELTALWLDKLSIESSLKVEDLIESWKSFLSQISPSV